ncbi:hypothetical protein EJ110_NYTH48625 [Nymphaea thermarum]|nr:hypothetical protein EJ110_NYTH48625 [Nymphaea thermarum]
MSQERGMVTKQGKSLTHHSMGSTQVATPIVEGSSSSTIPETITVSIDRVEYEQFLAHKASQALASIVLTDRAFSVGTTTPDSRFSWIIDSGASKHFYNRPGHLEDRCLDKYGRPSAASLGRNVTPKQGKNSLQSPIGSVQAASSVIDESLSSSHPEIVTVSINKSEYEDFLEHISTQPSASTVMIDSAMSVDTIPHDTCTTWIIDSGASKHFCSRSSMFTVLHSLPQTCHVRLADGRWSPIMGYGDIKISQSMTIPNVLYAPKFPTNMLSVGQLINDLHCRVTFDSGLCLFQDLQTEKTIGGGYKKVGICFLSDPMGIAASSITSLSSSFQWHLRLGHPSVSKLHHLLPHLSIPKSFQCEACQLGKHTRSSYSSSLSSSSCGLFDLLHVDVWGPSRVAS